VNISLASLSPGAYTLEVETRTSEGHAISRREIVLVDRFAARPLPMLRALEQPVPPEDNQSGAQVSFVRRRAAGGGGGQ
jgi:hypothetical protein